MKMLMKAEAELAEERERYGALWKHNNKTNKELEKAEAELAEAVKDKVKAESEVRRLWERIWKLWGTQDRLRSEYNKRLFDENTLVLRLRKALAWYADEAHYYNTGTETAQDDKGQRARRALKRKEDELNVR